MTSKLITLAAFGFPEVMIGYGIAPRNCPGEAFILIKEKDQLFRAFYQDDFHLPPMMKQVHAGWIEMLVMFASELKPLSEFFEPETGHKLDGIETKWIKEHPSISEGKIESGPYAGMYKADVYAMMPATPGDTMHSAIYRTCLKIFFEVYFEKLFGIKLSCVNAAGELIQPILARLEYEVLPEGANYPYQVTVNVTDGIAPFEYSSQPNTGFTNENVFAFEEPQVAEIYVKDAAGTVVQYVLNTNNWIPEEPLEAPEE